ncbi:hypothetical protein [Actinopolymorpha rutila]|uniref:Uncharacterized protein n=1 Tax=Actinopolymorpha rutila TaxID=446787 RepID=A0A852ZKT6_9ACTN|nr:hypothetical protein [Actinopolymorpha rutila]NYH93667.1 hypothetical protein [Actinopolymorpha rutila]
MQVLLGHAELAEVRTREGRVLLAVTFTVEQDTITAYDVIADPACLARLTLAVPDD